jgi:hypothetical protein
MEIRPLYRPEQIVVKEDSRGFPVKVGRGQLTVTAVEDRWRIDDEWWRTEPISRMYYSVILNNGIRMVIYKDLLGCQWYQQKIGSN